jgi:hypothetical protein
VDAPGPEYDPRLWFHHLGCSGKHFLLGNPHTFVGRMWAWCPVKKVTFFVSKVEIGETSQPAKYWIQGFLSGSEPRPPSDAEGDTDFGSPEYRNWERMVTAYHETGDWRNTKGRKRKRRDPTDA